MEITNYRLIEVEAIYHDTDVFTINYGIAPFYYRRVVSYQIEEFIQWMIVESDGSACSVEHFMENGYEILTEDMIRFHYAQTSISLRRTVQNCKKEIQRLRDSIEGIRRKLLLTNKS
jgi:hypothetical protein